MARPQKPWFRSSKDAWYATVNGKRVSFGIKARENRRAAYEAWHRLFLRVLYASGARPGEVVAITVESFDADAGLVRSAEHKTAHKGFRRAIYLAPEAVALLVRQRERYQSGHLLRASRGEAWTKNAIGLAMRRTRERAGIPDVVAYGLRHTFATDALANGVPDAQVAELLGNSGTAMLHRHYAHLGVKAKALRDAVDRVR